MTNSTDTWGMNDDDRDLLAHLLDSIYSFLSFAKSGNHLIAIGEVVDAIESLLNGDQIEINVGLIIGFERGDLDFKEGLFLSLRINDEELILDELNTSYLSSSGSDRYTVEYVYLTPESHINEVDLTRWLERLTEIQSYDDAKLKVSQDHIQKIMIPIRH